MPREVVVPNIHLLLIHFPIALLALGSLIELFAFLWRESSARIAARWMILLGTILAVPTAATGFYDFYCAAPAPTTQPIATARTWPEFRAAVSLSGEQWQHLERHALVTSAAIIVLLFVCMIYIGGSDGFRHTLHIPLLIVVVVCVAAIFLGTYRNAESLSSIVHPPSPSSPLLVHLLLASIALPIAMVSLGLSFRAAATSGADLYIESHPSEANYATAFVPRAQVDIDFDRPRIEYRHVPAARFWLLSAFLVLVAIGAGVWMLSAISGASSPHALYDSVVQLDANKRPEPTRRFVHAVAAVACLLLPLILALSARLSPRRGFIAAGFGLLMLISLAATIWTGGLLMFDSPEGPLTRFNAPVSTPSTMPAPIRLETTEPATRPSIESSPVTKPTTPITDDQFNRDL